LGGLGRRWKPLFRTLIRYVLFENYWLRSPPPPY
jgi:hypothetical protein